MAKSKTIRVTPNIQKCLDILNISTKELPAGETKKQAESALKYLSDTFKGIPQPGRGFKCPPDRLIIIG